MSSTAYHHGNLREALVDAAIEVAREQGPNGLSLRDLARRVGVSHNAAYRHFADRDALVEAVAERGMTALLAAMRHRIGTVSETDERLAARRSLAELGRGYVEFAMAEPGLFRVAFSAYPETPEVPSERQDDGDLDPFTLLNQALDDLVEVGVMDAALRHGAEIACWSTVHGFSVLHLDGPLRSATSQERAEALERVLISIDRSYGAPDDPDLFGVGS